MQHKHYSLNTNKTYRPIHRAFFFLPFVLSIIFSQDVFGQLSSSRLIKEGDKYYERNLYRAALKYYTQGGNLQTWKKDTKLKAAKCYFEVNNISESIKAFQNLQREGKVEPDVFLYLGKNFQHRNQFKEAISFYKQYLRKKKADPEMREWVKDEILRCANGIKLSFGEEIAYVENLGPALNTLQDETMPIPSATYQDRIYFTSNREGSVGGKLTDEEVRDNFFGRFRSDIYTLDQVNGAWEAIEPLGGNLNTSKNESLYDISPNGQILYFLRGNEIVTDTFESRMDRPNRKGVMYHPVSAQKGDQDLQIFNDTIMLFSSNQRGGFGGHDLFICVKRFGRWLEPENLGPEINSFYDERNPYLANDGRTLFFSSNNLKSIGGMDIFSAVFSDQKRSWSVPKNVGMPINSSGDDVGFSIRNDGLSAFFSSDRKDSYGGKDIYLAYFKDQIREHLSLSDPITFFQALEKEIPTILIDDDVSELLEDKEYFVSDLFYESNDIILTPQNIKKIDLISNMMQIYPKIEVELICHDVTTGPSAFALYFSVKKAEKVRDYMIRKGVQPDRIMVKGTGNKYPLAKEVSGQSGSPMVKKLNKRIDVRFFNYEEEPVTITKEEIQIPENIEDPKGKLFNIVTRDLFYQIELLTATQMYQNELLEDEDHILIEFDPDRNRYIYRVGLEQTYARAKVKLQEIQQLGYPTAKIHAFINGKQLKRHELIEWADKYPDLLNFFE